MITRVPVGKVSLLLAGTALNCLSLVLHSIVKKSFVATKSRHRKHRTVAKSLNLVTANNSNNKVYYWTLHVQVSLLASSFQ